ncbi:MAG: heme biosynthesis HemY N-terminal domain-containing protein [Pseudomonadota bacterium]
MIWSVGKVIFFVCFVAALALGAGYLLESEGGVQIIVAGQEYTLGPLESVIGLLVLMLVLWILLKLIGLLFATWSFINGDETAITRYLARNRLSKGYDALSEGLMALASGEGRLAMAKAEKANKYLGRPDLTNLLMAEAAELVGDRKKAETTYRKLVEDKSTRFVGVRGLMKQKLADGDTDTALKLAEKAFALKPRHEEVQDTLLRLQAEKADWKGARQTLSAKLKHGVLPRDVFRRRDAVLALSQAKSIFAEDQTIEAREAAIAANKQSPDLVPAAVMAALGYLEKGQKRHATRVIKKAWEVAAHPALAAAFAQIEPDESTSERVKRFAVLTRTHPEDAETKQLLAELYIADEDFPAARRALGDLVETDLTVRSATLMAAIERGEGSSDAVVQGWLARAVTAPRGPSWVCENCNHSHAEWAPVCENCKAFDTLSWSRPQEAAVSLPGGAELLPLLVAGRDDPSVEDVVEIVENADFVEGDITSSDDDAGEQPDDNVVALKPTDKGDDGPEKASA